MEVAFLLLPEWFELLMAHVPVGSAGYAALRGAVRLYGLLHVRCDKNQAASLLDAAFDCCPPAASVIRDALDTPRSKD